MTQTFDLLSLMLEEKLREILLAAAAGGKLTPDSVLAQVSFAEFDAAKPGAHLKRNGEPRIAIRVVTVPAKTVPKVYKLIEAERAKMRALEEAEKVVENKAATGEEGA